MTIEYLIRKRETCPVCEGNGYVPNANWQRINRESHEWMQDHGIKTFTDEASADWEQRIKKCWPYRKPPPEEEWCCECEGTGFLDKWVHLEDALSNLGIPSP